MNSFTYWTPTKVVFGADTANLAGSEVKSFGGTNALVIYGGGRAVKSGLLETVTQSLSAQGISYHCVGGVQPNPLIELVQQIVDEHKDNGIDFVLGVGGGSVLDTAKATAHGLASPENPVWDFFCGKAVEKSLPVGVVLTIAAAGSEMSNSSVLTNQALGTKRGLKTQFNRPAFAIMDPVLTYSLPARETACGITDILMHTIERYFGAGSDNAITDELAAALMRVVIRYGIEVLENPSDYKARSEIMWAGSLSHNGLTGLGQTEDFATHQLGHALSAKYDTPHGESLSAVWPSWANHVLPENVSRFAQYARSVWGIADNDNEKAAEAGIEATKDFFHSLGMPTTLTQAVGAGVKNDLEELTRLCTYDFSRTIGFLKVLDDDDIRAIYNAAL